LRLKHGATSPYRQARFPYGFRKACTEAFKPETVKNAFAAAGLVPYELDRVISKLDVQLRTPISIIIIILSENTHCAYSTNFHRLANTLFAISIRNYEYSQQPYIFFLGRSVSVTQFILFIIHGNPWILWILPQPRVEGGLTFSVLGSVKTKVKNSS
jgi:hypothetical protein